MVAYVADEDAIRVDRNSLPSGQTYPDPYRSQSPYLSYITTISATAHLEDMHLILHDAPSGKISELRFDTDIDKIRLLYLCYEEEVKEEMSAYQTPGSCLRVFWHKRGSQPVRPKCRGRRESREEHLEGEE